MSGSQNTHSRLAPSAAKRWTTCTASIGYCAEHADRIPEDTGSAYAQEGTQAHDFAEAVLNGDMNIKEVPADFRPHIAAYTRYCKAVTPKGADVLIEEKSPLFYKPDDHGTVDYAALSPEKVVLVDLKYGQGVLVDAVENPQLAIYARSLVDSVGFLYGVTDETEVEIRIYQPRYVHAGDNEPDDCWGLTVGELKTFTESIGEIAEQILNGVDVEFNPSDEACRWCPAKAFCVARMADALDALPDEANPVVSSDPSLDKDEYSDGELVNIFTGIKKLNKIVKDVEEYLTDLALSGTPAPGTKLVLGRQGNRQWSDEEDALRFLNQTAKLKMDDCAPRKIVTPTQAEKLVKDRLKSTRFFNAFDGRITRSPAKPTLALADDKRPAIDGAVADQDTIDALDEL